MIWNEPGWSAVSCHEMRPGWLTTRRTFEMSLWDRIKDHFNNRREVHEARTIAMAALAGMTDEQHDNMYRAELVDGSGKPWGVVVGSTRYRCAVEYLYYMRLLKDGPTG